MLHRSPSRATGCIAHLLVAASWIACGGSNGAPDAGFDADGLDASPFDGAVDASPFDGAADSALHDASLDATSFDDASDAAFDASTDDAALDASTDDAALDDAALDASTDAATLDAAVDGGMGDPRDVVWPMVTVEQAATQADPASSGPLVFDVTFDEPIAPGSLTSEDFVVTPSLASVEVEHVADGRFFEVRLSSLPRVDAFYTLTLPWGRVTDLSGNPSHPATSEDARVFLDDPGSTVEVRKYPPITYATGTLPIPFQVLFQARSVTGFDASDVENGGTATGVTWSVTPLSEGYAYVVSATAIGGEGTVFPRVRAASTLDLMTRPNTASVYVDTPVVYSPRPILRVSDADDPEGNDVVFRVAYEEGRRGTSAVVFDWSTTDGRAIAGEDYVAGSGTDVTIVEGGSAVNLRVRTIEDTTPEPPRDFQLTIRNVRGDVLVLDDTARGIVLDDDVGYWSFGTALESNPDVGPTEVALTGSHALVFGESTRGSPSLQRREITSGSLEAALTVSGAAPGGLTLGAAGYYLATNAFDGGYQVFLYDTSANSAVFEFADFGELEIDDLERRAVDLAADARLFTLGQRTRAGDTSWFLDARDGATGAPLAGFGTGGDLVLDRVLGAAVERPIDLELDDGALYVLGTIDDAHRVEMRDAATGALVPTFGSGGVLVLSSFVRVADVAVHDGALYVLGVTATESVVERRDASTGAREWVWPTVVDDPRCVHANVGGLFFGGGRAQAMHLERWRHDGVPVWARTFNFDHAPAEITAIVEQPGSPWIHVVGVQTSSGFRDWYYDRRTRAEGFHFRHDIDAMPE